MLLSNKVAMIVDVASDIGETTARVFADHGADLIVTDRNADAGYAVARRIRQSFGDTVGADFIHADVAQPDQVQNVVDFAASRKSQVDIVYINTLLANAPLDGAGISEAEWESTFNSSLAVSEAVARYSAPTMETKSGGVIIIANWSDSLLSMLLKERENSTHSSELLALTRTLANDLAPRIRVNALLVGAVKMNNGDRTLPSDRERISEACMLKRFGRPDDVARASLFLASYLSTYMTGTSITVDGGLYSGEH